MTICMIVIIIMAIRAAVSRTKIMANFDNVVKNSIVMTVDDDEDKHDAKD
jgi:hypothetical protein